MLVALSCGYPTMRQSVGTQHAYAADARSSIRVAPQPQHAVNGSASGVESIEPGTPLTKEAMINS